MTLKTVGVVPSAAYAAYRELFLALSLIFPIEFRESEPDSYVGLDGLLLFDSSREAGTRAAAAGIRSYVILKTEASPVHCGSAEVDFDRASNLHASFRDQTLVDVDVKEFVPLSLLPGDETVASKAGHVLWAYRPEGRSSLDLVAAGPPGLADDQYLCEYFQAGQFLRLLPLFHFLRDVTKDIAWTAPSLRACFVVDDPNLHGSSYGYINYENLVQHATVHNYHVSLATIPIDTWYVHSETALLFRENPSRISLLIHGNNHTQSELLSSGSQTHKLGLLVQALRRIERFERKSGLEVSRVMSAPHSACSEDMMRLMLQLGYEAACIPWDSLFHFNPHHRWSAVTGLDMVDFQGCGLPVISRIRLRPDWNPQLKSYADWKAGILLAAFLSQPVVLICHHWDASGGMQLLAEAADCVNRLGNVVWMNMKGIARSNYMTRSEGKLLRIRMCSRHIAVQIPKDIDQVSVERPWIADHGESESLLCKQAGTGALELAVGRETTGIPVQPLETIEFSSVPNTTLRHSELRPPPFSLWPLARRLMTEGRDRVLPFILKRR